MSGRAVYIPPGNRNKNKPNKRFHGAFTGGFSAGYFNTVDTKEGWKPSSEPRKKQGLEDFMDEQDHEEWGGPTNVRRDYAPESAQAKPSQQQQKQQLSLDTVFTISHQSIGPKLLRRLGWREEAEAAFVPSHDGAGEIETKKDDGHDESAIVLSKKRLRKIKLQSSRVKIPPPKLDQCGLGFEPHKDAPEFQKYREQRQEMARQRGSGGGSNNNVYRTSDLMSGKQDADQTTSDKQQRAGSSHTDDYLSYETAEDFVGKKSVGGFALRDDEDDAYDYNHQHTSKLAALQGDYNTEIYEHQDSDDEVGQTGPSSNTNTSNMQEQQAADFGGILSSWANTSTISTTTKSAAVLTSNGRPPVEGFVLGASMDSLKKRYPGPDIPRDYRVKRHIFGENEHPLIFQTIARAVQLQERQSHRHKFQKGSLATMQDRQQKPLAAGANFVNLADQMKSRFTTSKSEEPKGPERVGLHMPEPVVTKQTTNPEPEPESKKPISIQRTLKNFLPHPLLCKRFGVPVPKNAMGASFDSSSDRVTEAAYFEKEILPARNQESESTKVEKVSASETKPQQQQDEQDDPVGIERPSMEKLKSIFEPQSDSESSTDLDASSSDGEQSESDKKISGANAELTQSATEHINSSSEMVTYDNRKTDKSDASAASASSSHHRKDRRRRKSHRRHSRKQRKRSRSPDSDDSLRRKKDRKKRHERKRRKKSSRRKKDKDHKDG